MDVSDSLRMARRAVLISTAGAGARLLLFGTDRPAAGSAGGAPAVAITLATPIGQVGDIGVTVADSDYAQAFISTDIKWARLETFTSDWIADFSAGESDDDPRPELIMPSRRVFAGAFYRLQGSSIVCD